MTNKTLAFSAIVVIAAMMVVGSFVPMAEAKSDKITICHNDKKTISVSENALAAHLAHGDYVGTCEDGPDCDHESNAEREECASELLVTLSADPTSINENPTPQLPVMCTTITVALSATTDADVTVELGYSGTATLDVDYTTGASEITIPEGETTESFEICAIDDALFDEEEIVVDITDVTNAVEDGIQQVTIEIFESPEDSPF